jgi:hypothetical protein
LFLIYLQHQQEIVLNLKPLMTMYATLHQSNPVGPGPGGNRVIADISGGTFEGERLKGEILPSGADWIVIDDNGVGKVDVRATFRTHDGAHIYVQYYGILVFNEQANESLAGGKPAEFGDTHFITQPRFETGDERYTWLNSVMAVAEGRPLPNAVEYRMYEVTSG